MGAKMKMMDWLPGQSTYLMRMHNTLNLSGLACPAANRHEVGTLSTSRRRCNIKQERCRDLSPDIAPPSLHSTPTLHRIPSSYFHMLKLETQSRFHSRKPPHTLNHTHDRHLYSTLSTRRGNKINYPAAAGKLGLPRLRFAFSSQLKPPQLRRQADKICRAVPHP